MKKSLVSPLLAVAGFGLVILGTLYAWNSGNRNLPADILGTSDETTLLEIQLDTEKVNLNSKETYTFTSYGVYSTTTVPLNTYWTLANTSLGTLSCGSEKAKTCTFTAGATTGSTTLTASRDENGTTLKDSATISVTAPVVSPYKDTLPTWAQTSVISMYNTGIMTGYSDGNFGGSDSLTNAQVVTLLYRLLVSTGSIDASDLTSDKSCAVYTDVPKTHYAYTPICYFYRSGWVNSTSTKFNPNQVVSRGAMSDYVYKVFGSTLDTKNSASLYSSSYSFTDVKSTSFYYTAVQSLSTAGIMTGYGNGQFGLNVNVNRFEAAVILSRLFDLLNSSEEETEPTTEIDEDSLFSTCSNESYVRNELVKLLGDDLSTFELRTFDADELENALDDEKFNFVLAEEDGSLTTKTLTFTYTPLLEDYITVGAGKMKNNSYTTISFPKELSYQVACDKTVGVCGVLTVLDEEGTQIEGAFMDDDLGLSLIEPADNLIRMLGGTSSEASAARGCHVIYNSANHVDVLADDSCTTEEETTSWLPQIPQAQAEDDDILEEEIRIMLDSDAEFYKINEATVWSRQRSIMTGVNLIYGLVEPLGNANFNIMFKIAGQETWLDGYGPTTTNKVTLSDEINDEDYYMIHHPDPDDNEVSFFYVGYDMDTGIAGRAGGVGTFCGKEDENLIHAWGQQVADANGYQFATFYGRFIVAGHELAHLFNATHGNGIINTCGVGLWEDLCGSTIMASGAAGGADPDDRMPFFSPTNSDRVRDCVEEAL